MEHVVELKRLIRGAVEDLDYTDGPGGPSGSVEMLRSKVDIIHQLLQALSTVLEET